MDKRKSVKGPNAARDKPMSTDSSTQAHTCSVTRWRRHPFVAALTHAASARSDPARSTAPERKIHGGMLQLAFHMVQHTSPGLACSPDKAKLRCWTPQADRQTCRGPPHKSRSPTRRAGSLSHCQDGRLDVQAASPTAKMADSTRRQFLRLPNGRLGRSVSLSADCSFTSLSRPLPLSERCAESPSERGMKKNLSVHHHCTNNKQPLTPPDTHVTPI